MSTDFRDLLDDLARADTVGARVTAGQVAHARHRRRTRHVAGAAAGVLALALLAGGIVRLGSGLIDRPVHPAGTSTSVVMPTQVLIPAFDAPALVEDGVASVPRVTAVLYDDETRGVYALDAATGRAYRVDGGDVDDTKGTEHFGPFSAPVVSPDGSLVGYLADEAAVVVDLDAGSVQTVPLSTHQSEDGQRGWALLDSAVLVYVEDDGGQVHVVDLATGGDRALSIMGAHVVRPATADEAYVSFLLRAGLPSGGSLDVRTGALEEARDLRGSQNVVVAPDGRRLATTVPPGRGSRLVVEGSVGEGDTTRRLPGDPIWDALGWTRQGIVLHHLSAERLALPYEEGYSRTLFVADPTGEGPLRRWTALPESSYPPSLATGALAEAVLVPAPELPWWDPAATWVDDQPLEVPLLALASLVAVVWAIRRERSRRLP